MKLRTLDLFSGIGGFSLGLERTQGFETVAFCEINPDCRKVLGAHWPNVPIHDDVRTLRASDVGAVRWIVGGFPCQDASVAKQITRAERRRQRCQAAYDKTKSHVWLARLRDATTAALKASVAR